MFICQLSESEQNDIRKKLEQHAIGNGYELEFDSKNNEYLAMSGRLVDIEEVLK